MRSIWADALANLVVVAAVLAAYHWTLGPGARAGAKSGGDEATLESLEAEVARLAGDVEKSGAGRLRARLDERLATAEKRLASLESGTPPTSADGGRATPPADRTWTEGDLYAVREMLAEIEVRKGVEREETAIREMLKAAGPSLDDSQLARAVPLIYAHNEAIKALWKASYAGGAPGPGVEGFAKADDAKRALEQGLKAILPADVVEALKPRFSDLPRDLK